MKKFSLSLFTSLLICLMVFSGCGSTGSEKTSSQYQSGSDAVLDSDAELPSQNGSEDAPDGSKETVLSEKTNVGFNIDDIEPYTSKAYVAVNDNIPYFTNSDLTDKSFEKYSPLDSLGRCSVAYACIGKDLMPEGERENIGSVKPSGWHTVKYDNVDGKYLYNRCHLIGFQLSGEQANKENLITGTRYMNVEGMLPFENMIADYVKETGNHVMYRVSPVFEGNNLLATGVLMEAYSVEDKGEGICFNVFCYNEQPGIKINHATGESSQVDAFAFGDVTDSGSGNEEITAPAQQQKNSYVANTNTKKFHTPDCASAKKIKESNRVEVTCTRDEMISDGYEPCKNCIGK